MAERKVLAFNKPRAHSSKSQRGERRRWPSASSIAPVLALILLLSHAALQLTDHIEGNTRQGKWADVRYVYDGDTMTVTIDASDGTVNEERIRIVGIDTAELGGARCEAERALAIRQRDHLVSLVGRRVRLHSAGRDRYGRMLAEVYSGDGDDVAERMIAEAGARPYSGGQRSGWC